VPKLNEIPTTAMPPPQCASWLTVNVWPAIVTVPLRATPVVFAATDSATVPLPVPEPPLVIVIHGTLGVAVHGQPELVVTTVKAAPPAAGTDCDDGAMAKLHAPCVTVNVWPATVTVPVRAAPVVLAAADTATVPLPVPELPLVIVIHGTFGIAVHVQAGPVVTIVEAAPPPTGTDCDDGAMAKLHAAAACMTLNVWPAIVTVPVRAAPVFAATDRATVPLPVPEPPLVTVIHGTFGVAVHVQAGPVVTMVEAGPPPAGTDCDDGAMAKLHAAAACVMVNVWPVIVTVPVRAAPVFAAADTATVPLPVPDPPLVTVIHVTFGVAVHVQAGPVVTVVDAGPPLAGTDCNEGAIA
jgi:hypothetical protein